MSRPEVYAVGNRRRRTWLIATVFFLACATLLLFCIVTLFSSAHKSRIFKIDKNSEWTLIAEYRLPTEIKPLIYDLRLKIYLPFNQKLNFGSRNFTFDGNLILKILCLRSTNSVVLNAKNLSFKTSDVVLLDSQRNVLPIVNIETLYQKAGRGFNYFVKFLTKTPLMSGDEYSLSLVYKGILGNFQEGGLYKTSYRTGNETRYLAITQNQINDAHRLLPCFDEPEMKAKFNITVLHPRGTKAISNAAIASFRNQSSEWSETRFEVTPKMSTYLLALAVSDFEQNYRKCGDHVEIGVWARADNLDDFTYMTDLACPILNFYENYFKIPYPLKKLDLFVAPELRVLAMENWGLITASESSVAYNKQLSEVRTKFWVADVVAHEIAHMWFGNLATMRWWNDMWLNEGFATMMTVKAADFVQNTTMRAREYFTAEMTFHALKGDGYNEQPMSLMKNSTQAGTVLRMIEATVGDEEFRETLHLYLTKYAYKNADKDEFLNCFSRRLNQTKLRKDAFVHKNISLFVFLNPWFYQPGFPLIQVTRDGNHATISQHLYGTSGHKTEMNTLQWNVPLFVKQKDPSSVLWLRRNESLILHATGKPLLIDVDTRGYYRVNYDINSWNDLIEQLFENHTAIPTNARVKLIDDAFSLAEKKIIPYGIPLRMAVYLKQELNLSPLSCFFRHFDSIYERLKTHPNAVLFKRFAIFILEPLYHYFVRTFKTAIHEESDENVWIRTSIILKICLYGYKPCIDSQLSVFQNLVKNCTSRLFSDECNKVQPTARQGVYAVAAKYGGDDDFEILMSKAQNEESRFESQRLYAALGYTQNPGNVQRILQMYLDTSLDFKTSFQLLSYARRTYNDSVVSDFLYKNIYRISTASEAEAKQWLAFMTRDYNSETDIRKLHELAKDYGSKKSLQWIKDYVKNIEKDIRQRMGFVKDNTESILQFLASID